MTLAEHTKQMEWYLADERRLLALCIFREARGECLEAKRGVAWTVRNRVAMAPREGFKRTIKENVLKPYAFSAFNANDPNYSKFPGDYAVAMTTWTPFTKDERAKAIEAAAWLDCLAAVDSPSPDPTRGAVFYYSRPLTAPPAAWGHVLHTADLGGLHFYGLDKVAA